MKKIIAALICLSMSNQNAFAQQGEKQFAEYGASIGVSPFGGSLNFQYNKNKKTSFFVSLGGLPESKSFITPSIDGLDEIELNGKSSWMGFFLNHRPFNKADWFRVNMGIAIGSIENTITEILPGGGGEYSVNYKTSPVGYFGLGVGQRTYKGITFGFDLGLLYGGGPEITGPDPDKIEAISNSNFFSNVLPNLQLSLGYNF